MEKNKGEDERDKRQIDGKQPLVPAPEKKQEKARRERQKARGKGKSLLPRGGKPREHTRAHDEAAHRHDAAEQKRRPPEQRAQHSLIAAVFFPAQKEQDKTPAYRNTERASHER